MGRSMSYLSQKTNEEKKIVDKFWPICISRWWEIFKIFFT